VSPRERTPSYSEEEPPSVDSDAPPYPAQSLPELASRHTDLERRVRHIERANEKAAAAEGIELRKTLALMKDRAEERAASERSTAAAAQKAAEEKAASERAAAAAATKAEEDKAYALKQAKVARRAEIVKIVLSIVLTAVVAHVSTRMSDCRPITSTNVPTASATVGK
jgi:hypothetical protein